MGLEGLAAFLPAVMKGTAQIAKELFGMGKPHEHKTQTVSGESLPPDVVDKLRMLNRPKGGNADGVR